MSDDLLEDIYGEDMGERRKDAEFETMDIQEFCRKIQASVDAARNFVRDDLSPERTLSMAYYDGAVPDLAVMDSRSRMVSNDLRAVVAKVQPAVMRVFASSATVVDFVADESAVEDEIGRASCRERVSSIV